MLIRDPQRDFRWSKAKAETIRTEHWGHNRNINSASPLDPGMAVASLDKSLGVKLFLLPLKAQSSHIKLLTATWGQRLLRELDGYRRSSHTGSGP